MVVTAWFSRRMPPALLVLLAMCLPVHGAAQTEYRSSRTEHGHPDLQGVWNFTTPTPLERPETFGNREFLTEEELAAQRERRQASNLSIANAEAGVSQRVLTTPANGNTGSVNNFWMENSSLLENPRTSLIVYPPDGRLPEPRDHVRVQRSDANGIREIPGDRPVRFTHGGIDRTGPEDRGLSERCLVFNSGPPLLSGPYNNNLQIIQNADHVVILTEMGFDARIVPLGDHPHVDGRISLWSGDSRGRFEGDTLVVETRNFTPLVGSISLRELAVGDASERILTERFRPVDENTLEYEFTIDDPRSFTDRIVARWPMARMDGRIYEYACHAGNYALRNILRGARTEENSNGR